MNLEEFRAAIGSEKRVFATTIEFRDQSDGKPPAIQGHAAIFDRLSEELGDGKGLPFREKIKRGAFRKALDEQHDVRLLFNHDSNTVLGRTKSKTLELREDPKGLRVYSELDPEDQDTRRLLPKMRRGDIDQMSFGFTVADGGDSWAKSEGRQIRTIHEVDQLFDVSVVTFPAYPHTDVLVRAMPDFDISDEERDLIIAELEDLEDQAVDLTKIPESDTREELRPDGRMASAEQDAASEGMDDEQRLVIASLRRRVLEARIAAL